MEEVGYLSLCQDMCQDARGLKRRFQQFARLCMLHSCALESGNDRKDQDR